MATLRPRRRRSRTATQCESSSSVCCLLLPTCQRRRTPAASFGSGLCLPMLCQPRAVQALAALYDVSVLELQDSEGKRRAAANELHIVRPGRPLVVVVALANGMYQGTEPHGNKAAA